MNFSAYIKLNYINLQEPTKSLPMHICNTSEEPTTTQLIVYACTYKHIVHTFLPFIWKKLRLRQHLGEPVVDSRDHVYGYARVSPIRDMHSAWRACSRRTCSRQWRSRVRVCSSVVSIYLTSTGRLEGRRR